MDWAGILPSIIAAIVLAVGLPLALRKRRKAGPQNVEQFLRHLQHIGVRVSRLGKGSKQEKVGVSRISGQRCEGVIEIAGRNISHVNVISVTSQYGVNYFLDYLVPSPSWSGQTSRRRTRLVTKKTSSMRGKITDIEWKGDDYLAQQLNINHRLKDRLLQAELDQLKNSIEIFPEPKHEYARIRTNYLLFSPDLFEAMDIIAKHIRTAW